MGENRAGFRMPEQAQTVLTAGDMEEVRQEAYNDGFSEGKGAGYEAGLDEGRAAMQQQLELELTKIRQLIQAMQHPFQGFRGELVAEIKSTTRDLCEVFLRHTMTQDTALLDFLVDEAVKQLLPTDHKIVIHANQHNCDVVKNSLQEHMESDAWRLQVNNKLSDGNVFLESGHSRVKIDLQGLLSDYVERMAQIDVEPASE